MSYKSILLNKQPGKAWFLLACFLLALNVSPVLAQQLPYSQLTIADGLEDMVILDIEQDSEGFLWFTTRTGVNRFDGKQFWTFNQASGLPHNLVRDLIKTSDGKLWAGSESGLAWFDGTRFQAVSEAILPTNVPIRQLKEAPDGTLWAATYGMGLVQIDILGQPQILQKFDTESGLSTNRIRSLLIDRDGAIWTGDSEQVMRYKGGKLQAIPWSAEPSEIRTLYEHEDGTIWAGTRKGVTIFDGNSFVPLEFDIDLSNETINSIVTDSKQRIWLGSRDSGAYEFDELRRSVSHANIINGLPDNSINRIFEDNEKNLWFGTYGGGVARLSATNVTNWKAQEALPNPNVYALVADQDQCMWVGTNGDGVSQICGSEIKRFTTADGLSHNKVLTVAIDPENNPWFGTLHGLTGMIDGDFITLNTEDGLSGAVVFHIINAVDGGLWLGTNNGLSYYHQGVFTTYRTDDGLPDNRINRMYQSKAGVLWVASSNGLSRFNQGQFQNWTVKDGLAANFINDIYEDSNGLIWLATNNGLSTFDGENFNTWTTADGLPHNNAAIILESKRNNEMWIGTSRGVALFNGETFSVITTREGLVFDLVNRGAGFRDRLGNLWFGTAQGISRFAANFQPANGSPPPVRILSVRNDRQEIINLPGTFIKEQDTNLTFDFTAISFQRAPDINYRYRLNSKNSSAWRTTRLNQIQINSLKAGKYTFQVSARVGDGQWNSRPAQFSFVVTPPFWRTIEFALLVLACLVAAWIYRTWRIRQHALHLEKTVKDRTQQLEDVNSGLDWLANHDSLTRLANRHHVQNVLKSFQSIKKITPMGVVVIDLDYFKSINDQFGHGVGDVTLQLFSAMLKKSVHPKHTVARWGGEEFLIICSKIQLDALKVLTENILEQCRVLHIPAGLNQTAPLNCSIGFVHLTQLDAQSDITKQLEQCIQLADKALYSAKHQGRDQICGYTVNYPLGELKLNDYISDPAEAIKNKWIIEVN